MGRRGGSLMERRCALAEAEIVRAQRYCETYGCSWQVNETLTGQVRILCNSCGRTGVIRLEPRPKPPEDS